MHDTIGVGERAGRGCLQIFGQPLDTQHDIDMASLERFHHCMHMLLLFFTRASWPYAIMHPCGSGRSGA